MKQGPQNLIFLKSHYAREYFKTVVHVLLEPSLSLNRYGNLEVYEKQKVHFVDKISSSSVLSNLDETKSVDLPPVIELPPEEPE